VVRARRPERLPVVLTVGEVFELARQMASPIGVRCTRPARPRREWARVRCLPCRFPRIPGVGAAVFANREPGGGLDQAVEPGLEAIDLGGICPPAALGQTAKQGLTGIKALPIERDISFTPCRLSDIKNCMAFLKFAVGHNPSLYRDTRLIIEALRRARETLFYPLVA
jgi:hypothetical protein